MKKEKKVKEPKKKPKFGTLSCLGFMLKMALRHEPIILWIGMIAISLLMVLSNLTGLFLSPMILASIERAAPLGEVLLTIFIFIGATILIDAVKGYLGGFEWYSRITLRSILNAMISHKSSHVSYSTKVSDEKFGEAVRQGSMACGNNSAATEAIWPTIQTLIVNFINFGIPVRNDIQNACV